jgi:hypothetical protein
VDTLLAAEAGIRLGAAVDTPVVAAIPAAVIANEEVGMLPATSRGDRRVEANELM